MTTLFTHVSGTSRMKVTGRHRKPVTDEILVTVEHRTTGGGRAVILDLEAATTLAVVLSEWVEYGWTGVPRKDTDDVD